MHTLINHVAETIVGGVENNTDTTLLWLTAIGVGAALIAVIPNIRRAIQATVWRRPSLKRKLRGITTHMQLAYNGQLFGTGAFVSPVNGMRATVWVTPDAYILALSDAHDKALLYSITTRTRWFKPLLFRGHIIDAEGACLRLALGKTRFDELPSQPDGVQAGIGAHTANYDESYWYGNPGHYQHYVYSANITSIVLTWQDFPMESGSLHSSPHCSRTVAGYRSGALLQKVMKARTSCMSIWRHLLCSTHASI